MEVHATEVCNVMYLSLIILMQLKSSKVCMIDNTL